MGLRDGLLLKQVNPGRTKTQSSVNIVNDFYHDVEKIIFCQIFSIANFCENISLFTFDASFVDANCCRKANAVDTI